MELVVTTTAVQFAIFDNTYENVQRELNQLCDENGLSQDEIEIRECGYYTDEETEEGHVFLLVSYQKKIPAMSQ